MRYNISSGCIKVFSSEQDLHIGGAARMELERVEFAKGVFPIHNDIYLVKVHRGVHVYETILGSRIIHQHGTILVATVDCYRKIRDDVQKVGVVPITREVCVAISYLFR